MERYADFFLRRRGLVGGFVLVMSVAALVGLGRLSFDDVPRGIFVRDDADYARLQSVYADFGADDNDALLVLEASDWFAPEGLEVLRLLDERLSELPDTERVVSPTRVVGFTGLGRPRPLLPAAGASAEEREAARERAHAHPLVGGLLLSDDDRTVLVSVRQRGGALSVEEIRPFAERLDAICAEVSARPGFRARLTGVPSIRVEIYDTLRSEQVLFFALAAVLCIGLSWWLFRDLRACAGACAPPLLAAVWALGFFGLIGVPIDILSTTVPMLVVVISFTDCVHLMIDVRTSRAAGAAAHASAAEAIRHVGLPCALTSLTTAVGFGSLAMGDVAMIRRYGLLAAAGVAIAFLAVITTLPFFVSFLRSVGTPRARGRDGSDRGSPWIDLVLKRARWIAAGGVALLLGLGALATRLVPENRLTEALPRSYDSFGALLHAEQAFGGVLPAHVLVEWDSDLDAGGPELDGLLAEVEAVFDGEPRTSRAVSLHALRASLPPLLAGAPGALALLPADLVGRFVRPERRRALVSAGLPDGGTDVMAPLFERLRSALADIEARHPDFRLNLTGTDVVARSNVNRMIEGLARSLIFAAVVIFGVIGLEFRSVRLGLISLVPNLLPLGVVAGVLVLLGRPLQMASAVVFTILLGLAVDDTIHLLARYRREKALGTPEPLAAGTRRVGRAIAFTTVVLAAGHAVLLFSAIETTRLTGVLVCLGLFAALVGDLVLLPALLRVFHERRAA